MKRKLLFQLSALLIAATMAWGQPTFTQNNSFNPAAPGAIGGTTPAAGTFTTLTGTTVAGGMLATTAEAVAGTATDHITTPEGVAAAIAVVSNPKNMAQAVNMTAAASGSTGIQVADNDNIDFGTGNLTLVWKGSLPDWTPSSAVSLARKRTAPDGFSLDVNTTGTFSLILASSKTVSTTSTNTLVDGTDAEIVVSCTRETASVAGTANFYVNGVLFQSVTITAASPPTLTNAFNLYISGSDSARYASGTRGFSTFNRALTAAEVLSLYRNGISFADKWGSQTSIITGNDSTFAGASNWANTGSIASYDETTGGVLTITANSANQYCDLPVANATTVIGKKYRLTYTSASLTSTWTIKDFTRTQTIGTISTAATVSVEFTATTTGGLSLVAVANDSSVVLDNFLLYEIGATLALESEGIQPSPGQCLDSSSNKNHGMQPAAGSSLARTKKDFEYRWTNTWSASSAAQYVGGLNQAALSVDHFITSIVTQATVTTDVENLELGDGSAVAKFVAAFTPSATRTSQTVAAQNDGTNLKLVYTPAAEATMTVETIIRGFIWEP